MLSGGTAVSVQSGWSAVPLGNQWEQMVALDLAAAGPVLSGTFYLMFSQSDDFPFANLDGIAIDDVELNATLDDPTLSLVGVCGSQCLNVFIRPELLESFRRAGFVVEDG